MSKTERKRVRENGRGQIGRETDIHKQTNSVGQVARKQEKDKTRETEVCL